MSEFDIDDSDFDFNEIYDIEDASPPNESCDDLHDTVSCSTLFAARNVPITTERTISLISSSAPQHLKFKNNFSKLTIGESSSDEGEHDFDVDNNYDDNNDDDNGDDDEGTIDLTSKGSPEYNLISVYENDYKNEVIPPHDSLRCSSNSVHMLNRRLKPYNNMYNEPDSTDLEYGPKGSRRMQHNVKSTINSCNPNLVRFDDEESGVIGSLPADNQMEVVQNKRIDRASHRKPVHHSAKAKRDNKFITINTLSFSHYLSPETPFITLGHGPKRLLISVGIHGDEPCGIIAFNQLLQEGFFNSLSSSISVCFK